MKNKELKTLKCRICGKEINKNPKLSNKQFENKKYDLARLGKGLITLKELPISKRDKEILSLIAVKWVKSMKEPNAENYNAIKHFMNFFNLTEEDLE